jgi:hypothetical protein
MAAAAGGYLCWPGLCISNIECSRVPFRPLCPDLTKVTNLLPVTVESDSTPILMLYNIASKLHTHT